MARPRGGTTSPTTNTVKHGRKRAASLQPHLGEAGELVEERVLKRLVESGGGRRFAALVVPVTGGSPCRRIVGHGEPGLGAMAELEVVGCARAAHPGRHPPRVDYVDVQIRPPPR